MKRLLGGLGMALGLACAGQQATVQLQGDPMAIATLAGRWGGEYWGASAGRRGSLSFEVRAGSDTLFGDVLMMDAMGNAVRAADPVEVHRQHARSAQQLQIAFVQAARDSVRGVLEPYVAPDCDCVVTTSFAGELQGDRITGTFETRSASIGILARGFWEMLRAK